MQFTLAAAVAAIVTAASATVLLERQVPGCPTVTLCATVNVPIVGSLVAIACPTPQICTCTTNGTVNIPVAGSIGLTIGVSQLAMQKD